MIPLYVLFGITLLGIAFLAWQQHQTTQDGDPKLKAELDRRNQEIGELKSQMIEMKSEKDEQAGKSKQLFASFKDQEAELKMLQKERDALLKNLQQHESQQEHRTKEHQRALEEVTAMKNSFEEEKKRIAQEDVERQEEEAENRDRMWAEHEVNVVALMYDICKQPQTTFSTFDNTNLPEGFHGSLKPDFMIEFLEQYVIFDAKVSKAKSLQTYINDTVKKTATKVKGNDKIYPTIFLVVPTQAAAELKKSSFYEEGFTFYVISPEAIAPILASLKRIEQYEFAEAWDPKDREAIIDLIAHYHAHIASRNSFDYLIIEEGLNTLKKTSSLDPEIAKEALMKAAKIRNLNMNTAEQKELTANPEALEQRMSQLVSPAAAMPKEEIAQAKKQKAQTKLEM